MTQTSPLVLLGLYDLEVREAAVFTAPDKQTFVVMTDLQNSTTVSEPYATFEPDFWLLDGGYKFKPASNPHAGLISLSMSDSAGDFGTPPTLQVVLDTSYDIDGVTILFSEYSGDYSDSVRVQCYNAADTLISNVLYAPTGFVFSTDLAVASVKKIILTFYSTSEPFRYLRVSGFEIGNITTFTETNIKRLIVTENMDAISASLPIGTADIHLHTDSFSAVDPTNPLFNSEMNRVIDIYEIVDGVNWFIGRFYLDDWDSPSEKNIVLHCVDGIGIVEAASDYLGYQGFTAADTVIDEILEGTGIHSIEDDNVHIFLNGLVPPGNRRTAIQAVAFFSGVRITCARSKALRLGNFVLASDLTEYDHDLGADKIGVQGKKLTLLPLIAGVEITEHSYPWDGNATASIYEEVLDIGTYTRRFDLQYFDFSVAGGTLISAIRWNVMFSVASDNTTVTISAKKHVDTSSIASVYTSPLPKNPNIVQADVTFTPDAFFTPTSNPEQHIYDYYQQRYNLKFKLFASRIQVGESAIVDTIDNKRIAGMVEKIVLDLAGGFIAEVEIRGVLIEP